MLVGAISLTFIGLLGLVLYSVANRPQPPGGTASYAGRANTLAAGSTWDLLLGNGLPEGAQVVEGLWATQLDPEPEAVGGSAICQTAGGPTGLMLVDLVLIDKRFPLLTSPDLVARDLTLRARFKLLSGNVDRAAGIAFRINDQDNYYVVRANGLEGNVNLYKFVDGRRSLLHEARAQVPSGVWQTLEVEARGPRLRWALEGRPLAEVEDSTYSGGGIGLWTKADSRSCFADFQAVGL